MTLTLAWRSSYGGGRHACVDGYKVTEILGGRVYIVEQLGTDGLPALSITSLDDDDRCPRTLPDALDLIDRHRSGALRPVPYLEWATGWVERYTAQLDALGDGATPAERAILRSNREASQGAIRRYKEKVAAGNWWCVTLGTGQHLVVPHGPRDNGGFGPVNVWSGYGYAPVRTRTPAHPSGACLHT